MNNERLMAATKFRVSAILPREELEYDELGGQKCLGEEETTAKMAKAIFNETASLTQSVHFDESHRTNNRHSLHLEGYRPPPSHGRIQIDQRST